jgi:hypothetical protein
MPAELAHRWKTPRHRETMSKSGFTGQVQLTTFDQKHNWSEMGMGLWFLLDSVVSRDLYFVQRGVLRDLG